MSVTTATVLAAAVALAVAGALLASALRAKQARLVALERALEDLLAAERQAVIRHEALLEQQDIVEKSVETGAKSAEAIHKTVAGVTFGILDSIPATEGVSRLVRGVHDGVSGSVYATVRGTNKQLGKLARAYLKEREGAARQKRPDAAAGKAEDSGTAGEPDQDGD